ncbi:MAG TPA: beta-L-arabinofuranosidase domain-containing protein, partial [Verrucomicrobiae bacterium]
DKRLLDRAILAMDRPEVQSSINDWLSGKFNPCHTVCYYEIIRIPAMFYSWDGNQKYLEASRKAFDWVDSEHMLPYGVASGGEFLSGIGPFRLTETCDVAASLWSRIWMYRITGEGSWGDQLEAEFFNAAAAPIARDFQTMCYYQSPNRLLSESQPIGHPLCPGPDGLRFTKLGCPEVLCCVGNMNRILPNYIIHMWMATEDGGLAAGLYGPCQVHALAGDHVPVKLTCRTDYPFRDTVLVKVESSRETTFPLYFRVPGWCHAMEIKVNGRMINVEPSAQGFVRIYRRWTSSDSVTLRFPMTVRLARAYADEYPEANKQYFGYLPADVFVPKRMPYESVYYGPLLFSLPIPDLDPNTLAPGENWRFALDNDPRKNGDDIVVKRHSMSSPWDWSLDAPITLKVPAREIDWNPTMAQSLPSGPLQGGGSRMISLVPYGCTKFRVSMFPVTEKAWEGAAPPRLAESEQKSHQ